MKVSRRVVLILLALCLITGIATGSRLYYRLAYFWGFLYAGSWIWSVYSLRGIQFKRSARTLRAQVGQVFEERFDVLNQTRLPRLWLEVQDQSNLPGSGGSRILTLIEGKQGRSYLARTRLLQRGAFDLGPTIISSGDPFGIFVKNITIPVAESLLVYPMMVDIQAFPNPPGLLPGGEALRRRTHQVTPNAAGVREYLTGDPMNRIHWLSTVRRRRLMVKEFELDPLADVWIFVDAAGVVQANMPLEQVMDFRLQDFWQKDIQISLPPSTEEYSISIAASLARYYLRKGRAVGLVSAGRYLTLLPPDRGGRQLGKILEALSLLQARGDIPLRGLVETQIKHMMRGSTIVLITPSTWREIALVAETLVRRGLRPVAVLLNTETFGGAEGSVKLAIQIETLGVPVRLVKNGDSLGVVLENGGLTGIKVRPEVAEAIA